MTTGSCCTCIEGPLGPLTLAAGEGPALTGIFLTGQRHAQVPPIPDGPAGAALAEAAAQLLAYFEGTRHVFDLPLAPLGTDFQRAVWRAIADIPYGSTATYGQLAERVGRPTAVRAVGMAAGRNPLPIVVPCHRVVGADGSLTGYAGGLDRKRWLLEHEAAHRWQAERGHQLVAPSQAVAPPA